MVNSQSVHLFYENDLTIGKNMRNWYNRKYIVIHEPIAERRGRTFERKLAEAESHGFRPVGDPTFHHHWDPLHGRDYVVGTILMVSISG